MEGVPLFPESPDDDEESTPEKKDEKDSQAKPASIFERLLKDDKQEDEDKNKKSFEWFKDDKPENKEEPEPPLETLADSEKQEAAEQYVEARAEEVKQELVEAPDDTPAEAAALANAALLENIQEKLDDDQAVDAELLDEAVAETLEDLGLEATAAEAEPEEAAETPDTEAEETPDDDDAATPATATGGSASPPPPPPVTPPAAAAGGGGAPPVVPAPMPSPPGPGMPGGSPSTPNVARAPQPEVVEVRNRRREATNLLAGGIVGYFIGRRRGRLKTEAKLLPVQEKLKKEVTDLHDQIALREEKIRKLTYARVAESPAVQQQVIERLERKATPEKPLTDSPAQPERLGKFAVLAERPPDAHTAERRPKPVDLMTRPELLAVAAKIEVEQSNAKRLFETGRLNEEGLRRVVRAYLRGERLEAVLKENLRTPEVFRTPETTPAASSEATQPAGSATNPVASLLAQHLDNPKPYQPYELPPDYQMPPTTKKPKPNSTAIIAGTAAGTAVILIILLLAL